MDCQCLEGDAKESSGLMPERERSQRDGTAGVIFTFGSLASQCQKGWHTDLRREAGAPKAKYYMLLYGWSARDYKTWDATLILGAGMYAKNPTAWAPGPGREGRDAGHPGGCLWCTELSLSSSSIVGLLRGGRQTSRNKVGSNKDSRLFVWEKQREKKTMLDLPVGVTCRSAKLVSGLSGHRTAYPDAYSSCEPSAFRSRCDPWVG